MCALPCPQLVWESVHGLARGHHRVRASIRFGIASPHRYYCAAGAVQSQARSLGQAESRYELHQEGDRHDPAEDTHQAVHYTPEDPKTLHRRSQSGACASRFGNKPSSLSTRAVTKIHPTTVMAMLSRRTVRPTAI